MEIISLIDFKENAVLLYVHYHNIYTWAIISFILSRNNDCTAVNFSLYNDEHINIKTEESLC